MISKKKKVLLSCFISLNLLTICLINRPGFFISSAGLFKNVIPNPRFGYILDYSGWLVRRYAHIAGLDNVWSMFSRQSRFNWWYVIKARYEHDTTIILPLAFQSQRPFWQRTFTDFKMTKFYLNIYPNEKYRESYARYLCRTFPQHQGALIEAINFELHWQNILPLKMAGRVNRYLEEQTYHNVINEFVCPKAKDGI